MVLRQKAPKLAALPFQTFAMQAAIDLLPDWARTMHGLRAPAAGRPLIRGGTLGLAKTLRWAFR